MKKCWNCNNKLAVNATSCTHCGVATTKEAVRGMATIGPGGGNVKQIVIDATIADRYEIRQELGRGGMGIVYLAYDKTLVKEVALKVIPQELCLDPRAVADLKRETGIALNLTHEHIVRLYNLDIWEGQAFVTMEYVSGGTLAHLLAKKERYALPEILPLLKQMAAALDYSHNASPPVIHRDLKPLNVLMTEDGRVKIADFGLARVLRDSASRISGHDSAGTLAYMAPEQVRGKGVGRHTDLYAFAAITYELLCGHTPFYTGDLRWQILNEEVEPIDGVSEHINQVLAQALDKEGENRPGSAAEFLELLTGVEATPGKQPVKKKAPQKQPKTQLTKEPTAPSRSPKLVFAAIAVLLLAILVTGGWFFRNHIKNIFDPPPILTLASVPAGAAVTVDGGKVGITPLTVQSLLDGAHTVKMTLDKYDPHEETIFIQQKKPVTIAATLTPEPFGDLEVKSDPAGAEVLLDGKPQGTTPLRLTRLPKGSRSIALNHPDFSPWQGQVEIVPFTPATVSEKLISAFGRLEVASNPPGAKVQINKKHVGTTPYNDPKLRQGEYIVTIEGEGFDSWLETVGIKSGQTTAINADLLANVGSLSVNSTPEGAEVSVDGKKVGTTPLKAFATSKGHKSVVVELPGYDLWTSKATIVSGKETEIKANMVRSLASFTVASDPSGAEVWIDGSKVGNTPYASAKIAPGGKLLELRHKGCKDHSQKIEVSPGKPVPIFVKLESLDDKLPLRVTDKQLSGETIKSAREFAAYTGGTPPRIKSAKFTDEHYKNGNKDSVAFRDEEYKVLDDAFVLVSSSYRGKEGAQPSNYRTIRTFGPLPIPLETLRDSSKSGHYTSFIDFTAKRAFDFKSPGEAVMLQIKKQLFEGNVDRTNIDMSINYRISDILDSLAGLPTIPGKIAVIESKNEKAGFDNKGKSYYSIDLGVEVREESEYVGTKGERTKIITTLVAFER